MKKYYNVLYEEIITFIYLALIYLREAVLKLIKIEIMRTLYLHFQQE